ncbi:Zinc-type alcohol dehydrogenase-like protein -like protein [Emericellopsis cladophorae]|uniref:Zinc-type alcohol dehydrogenase-like protein -like protein n=1 Tax=Emericellopsis cladophorae TaxID=2686198 RepID=A0A9P9Y9U4_9HYPO|nr:Zinc-type alcohol dehydrogenase-like protein -like protein [Emericellopsis cladophorae]KAI6785504.1 Zinc-type alcohol dehydrogenase-like protein -like protein [Emericellopsis cladophorae]
MTSTRRAWVVDTQTEDLSGLVLKDLPLPESIGQNEVLVEIKAASINYRDVVMVKLGSSVNGLTQGDTVVTHLVPENFPSEELYALDDDTLPLMAHITAGLGGALNGTLTTHAILPASCLVKFDNRALSFKEAATLSCSGITAWNALMGLPGRQVKKDDWVLVQGSGGVSVAALQFAVAVGANVVATTGGTGEKEERLRQLGAKHVINYRATPEWGAEARKLTPGGRGFDVIVDVGGHSTLSQTMKANKVDGLVVLAGMLGQSDDPVPLMSILLNPCTTRGIILGTRNMMRDMVEFVGEKQIKMATDAQSLTLNGLKDALARMEAHKHFAKIIVQVG